MAEPQTDIRTGTSNVPLYPNPAAIINLKTEDNSGYEELQSENTKNCGSLPSHRRDCNEGGESDDEDHDNLKEDPDYPKEMRKEEEGIVTVKEEFPVDTPLPPIPVLVKRRRTVLSLAEKADLLHRLREGASQKQLALEYGIGTSTVSDLKKHEAEILGFVAANGDEAALARRKLEGGARADVEEAVLSWLMQEASSGREVTGQQVQARARQEHQRLRGDQQQQFQASPGWLERFRRRYNLRPGRATYKRGRRRGRALRDEPPASACLALKYEVQDDEECEGQVCPEAVQPLVSVEEGHVSVQLPPVQDVPTAAEAATLLSRALVWAAAQQDTTPQQLFVIKQLQTRAALRGIMKGGL